MAQSAQITIARPGSYAFLRSYKIIVDEREIGRIRANEVVRLSITPGTHTIYLRLDWGGSNKIDFTASEGSEVKFECGTNQTGWRLFYSLIWILISGDEFLWIRMTK